MIAELAQRTAHELSRRRRVKPSNVVSRRSIASSSSNPARPGPAKSEGEKEDRAPHTMRADPPCDGAEACVDSSVWREVASQIAHAFARGDGTAGLVAGVARLAYALGAAFPHKHDDVNELPDQPQGQGVPS